MHTPRASVYPAVAGGAAVGAAQQRSCGRDGVVSWLKGPEERQLAQPAAQRMDGSIREGWAVLRAAGSDGQCGYLLTIGAAMQCY